MEGDDGATNTIPPSWVHSSGPSSSSSMKRSGLILAGEDCSAIFDPIGTSYDSKAEWIDSSNAKACQNGFRLYVGEGRSLKTKKAAATAGRLELACWKYRGKDAQGRRTRAGGCRFKLKGRELEGEDGVLRWQLVGGVFSHTHDCELGQLPSRATVTSTAPKKKRKKVTASKAETAALSKSPSESSCATSTDQSPPLDSTPAPQLVEPSVEARPILHIATQQDYAPGPASAPAWYSYEPPFHPHPQQAPLQHPHLQLGRAATYDVYTPYVPYQPHLPHPTAAAPSTYLLRALHGSAHQQQHFQAMPFGAPQPWSMADLENVSPISYLAPSPLASGSSPVSIADTPPSLISTANTTPASSVVSGSGVSGSRAAIFNLLRKTHPDLEQYADAWLATGADFDYVKTWNEMETHRFVDVDLVQQCPDLAHRPFHKWLLHLCVAHLKADDPLSPPLTTEQDLHALHQDFARSHSVMYANPMAFLSQDMKPSLSGHDARAIMSTSAPSASTSFPFL